MGLATALTRLRAMSADMRPDTAKILTHTRVSDGMGGYTETWAVTNTVSCRVSPMGTSTNEEVFADQLRGRVAYEIALPHDTAITNSNRLDVDGVQYEILSPLAYSYQAEARAVIVFAEHSVSYSE